MSDHDQDALRRAATGEVAPSPRAVRLPLRWWCGDESRLGHRDADEDARYGGATACPVAGHDIPVEPVPVLGADAGYAIADTTAPIACRHCARELRARVTWLEDEVAAAKDREEGWRLQAATAEAKARTATAALVEALRRLVDSTTFWRADGHTNNAAALDEALAQARAALTATPAPDRAARPSAYDELVWLARGLMASAALADAQTPLDPEWWGNTARGILDRHGIAHSLDRDGGA